MIGCKHCQTLNSLDSVFCRKCGTSLPESELQEAKEKLDQLISEGTHSFNEGRIDEAFAIAESAVASNPVSVNALALKGMCHERNGEIAEALEAYEQVVQLNPDSALDKIKLNQLRNLLVARTQPAPAPDRRLASIAAVAASVLVICLGALGATYLNKQNTAQEFAKNSLVGTPNGDAGTPEQIKATQETGTPSETPQNDQQTNPQQQSGTKIGEVPPVAQDPGTGLQRAPDDTVLRPLVPQGPIGDVLPAPNGGARSTPVPDRSTSTTSNPPTRPEIDPQPDVPISTTPEEDPGIIEIKVSRGGAPVVGGGEDTSASNANGAEALLRTARNQYETGNYGGAANSYERALRFGADAGLVNQRLGMTYERLGRKEDAITAYTKAIQALESAVAKGQTSKQRALDASRAALTTLKGGQ